MINPIAEEEIRKELKAEGFEHPDEVAEIVQRWIEDERSGKCHPLGEITVFNRLVKEYCKDKYQKIEPVPEIILREAEETRLKHSYGNFSSMNRDGLD